MPIIKPITDAGKGDQECQKSDFHQRKEADILFEKREEPFNIYEYCKK